MDDRKRNGAMDDHKRNGAMDDRKRNVAMDDRKRNGAGAGLPSETGFPSNTGRWIPMGLPSNTGLKPAPTGLNPAPMERRDETARWMIANGTALRMIANGTPRWNGAMECRDG